MNLKLRLQKIEAAIIPKVEAIRRCLFQVRGDLHAQDDQGRQFADIDEARKANPRADEYTCVDSAQIEIVKELHRKADTL